MDTILCLNQVQWLALRESSIDAGDVAQRVLQPLQSALAKHCPVAINAQPNSPPRHLILSLAKYITIVGCVQPLLCSTVVDALVRGPWPSKLLSIPLYGFLPLQSFSLSDRADLFADLYMLNDKRVSASVYGQWPRLQRQQHRVHLTTTLMSHAPFMAECNAMDPLLARALNNAQYPHMRTFAFIAAAATEQQHQQHQHHQQQQPVVVDWLTRLIAEELYGLASEGEQEAAAVGYVVPPHAAPALEAIHIDASNALGLLCRLVPPVTDVVVLLLIGHGHGGRYLSNQSRRIMDQLPLSTWVPSPAVLDRLHELGRQMDPSIPSQLLPRLVDVIMGPDRDRDRRDVSQNNQSSTTIASSVADYTSLLSTVRTATSLLTEFDADVEIIETMHAEEAITVSALGTPIPTPTSSLPAIEDLPLLSSIRTAIFDFRSQCAMLKAVDDDMLLLSRQLYINHPHPYSATVPCAYSALPCEGAVLSVQETIVTEAVLNGVPVKELLRLNRAQYPGHISDLVRIAHVLARCCLGLTHICTTHSLPLRPSRALLLLLLALLNDQHLQPLPAPVVSCFVTNIHLLASHIIEVVCSSSETLLLGDEGNLLGQQEASEGLDARMLIDLAKTCITTASASNLFSTLAPIGSELLHRLCFVNFPAYVVPCLDAALTLNLTSSFLDFGGLPVEGLDMNTIESLVESIIKYVPLPDHVIITILSLLRPLLTTAALSTFISAHLSTLHPSISPFASGPLALLRRLFTSLLSPAPTTPPRYPSEKPLEGVLELLGTLLASCPLPAKHVVELYASLLAPYGDPGAPSYAHGIILGHLLSTVPWGDLSALDPEVFSPITSNIGRLDILASALVNCIDLEPLLFIQEPGPDGEEGGEEEAEEAENTKSVSDRDGELALLLFLKVYMRVRLTSRRDVRAEVVALVSKSLECASSSTLQRAENSGLEWNAEDEETSPSGGGGTANNGKGKDKVDATTKEDEPSPPPSTSTKGRWSRLKYEALWTALDGTLLTSLLACGGEALRNALALGEVGVGLVENARTLLGVAICVGTPHAGLAVAREVAALVRCSLELPKEEDHRGPSSIVNTPHATTTHSPRAVGVVHHQHHDGGGGPTTAPAPTSVHMLPSPSSSAMPQSSSSSNSSRSHDNQHTLPSSSSSSRSISNLSAPPPSHPSPHDTHHPQSSLPTSYSQPMRHDTSTPLSSSSSSSTTTTIIWRVPLRSRLISDVLVPLCERFGSQPSDAAHLIMQLIACVDRSSFPPPIPMTFPLPPPRHLHSRPTAGRSSSWSSLQQGRQGSAGANEGDSEGDDIVHTVTRFCGSITSPSLALEVLNVAAQVVSEGETLCVVVEHTLRAYLGGVAADNPAALATAASTLNLNPRLAAPRGARRRRSSEGGGGGGGGGDEDFGDPERVLLAYCRHSGAILTALVVLEKQRRAASALEGLEWEEAAAGIANAISSFPCTLSRPYDTLMAWTWLLSVVMDHRWPLTSPRHTRMVDDLDTSLEELITLVTTMTAASASPSSTASASAATKSVVANLMTTVAKAVTSLTSASHKRPTFAIAVQSGDAANVLLRVGLAARAIRLYLHILLFRKHHHVDSATPTSPPATSVSPHTSKTSSATQGGVGGAVATQLSQREKVSRTLLDEKDALLSLQTTETYAATKPTFDRFFGDVENFLSAVTEFADFQKCISHLLLRSGAAV